MHDFPVSMKLAVARSGGVVLVLEPPFIRTVLRPLCACVWTVDMIVIGSRVSKVGVDYGAKGPNDWLSDGWRGSQLNLFESWPGNFCHDRQHIFGIYFSMVLCCPLHYTTLHSSISFSVGSLPPFWQITKKSSMLYGFRLRYILSIYEIKHSKHFVIKVRWSAFHFLPIFWPSLSIVGILAAV